MPSHTWNEVGRWAESVRANLQAWHSDQKAEIGEGVAIYPSHNLHMLLYAASMDGQGAIAIQAARDFTRQTGSNFHELLTLIRFGRFQEIMEVDDRPDRVIPRGVWDFSQGYANLRAGEPDLADLYLKRVQIAADTSTEAKYRGHPAKQLLGVLAGILEGEIHRHNDRLEKAIATLEATVALEDEMQYDEPEPLPFAARHWLGAALIEAQRFADAEQAYREELEDHPNNGWSLFGLLKALEAQGKPIEDAKAQFDESWGRADHWIRASRF